MAKEDQHGGDDADDALDALGHLLGTGGEPADDDAAELEAADLGALAQSSRARVGRDKPEPADDAGELSVPAAQAARVYGAVRPEPQEVPAPPPPAVEPPAANGSVPSASSGRGPVVLALLAGFGAGLASGALLFRSAAPGETVAALEGAQPPGAEAGAAAPAADEPRRPLEPVAVPAPAPAASGQATSPPEAGRPADPGAAPASAAAAAVVARAAAPADSPAPDSAPAAAAPSGREPSRVGAAAKSTAERTAEAGRAASGDAPASEPVGEQDDDVGARTLAAAFGPSQKPEADPPGAERGLDELLDQAFEGSGGRRDRPLPALSTAESLAPTPTREQVNEAMAVLLPAIRGCAMGQSGLATASIVVTNDGKVASVSVAGAPFAGAASGRCMEGVLRKARFVRFSQPTFRVKFPFAIK